MVGRYLMYDEIASGGMAKVHLGRLFGAVGFSRTVAIKQLHSHYSSDSEFVSMFVDEARLAARIQHPNVTAPLDVVLEDNGEIFLIMEYIHGDTLARLVGNARASSLMIPVPVSAGIMNGALHGLHAAHEAVDEAGQPLGIVHRDMSPQNIMVGTDGVARVLDFGIAKAASRCQSTRQGHLKGKLSYMAPEQMRMGPVDRRLDIFAAGIVLWEALTHRRLFRPDDAASAVAMIMHAPIQAPSTVNRDVPAALDKVVMKALERDLDKRFQSALAFADALEDAVSLASHRKAGEWVEKLCSTHLCQRAEKVSRIERSTFDPNSSKDTQALLFSKQSLATGATPQVGDATNSRDEIPPSTPLPLSRVIDGVGKRRLWPFAVAFSSIAFLAGVGGVYQLRRMDAATMGKPRPEGSVSRTTVPSIAAPQPLAPRVVQVPAKEPQQAPVNDNPGASPTEQRNAGPSAPQPPGLSNGNRRSGTTGPSRLAGKTKGPSKISKANRPALKKDCDPPYYLDANGIRRVKPQCL
jgi:eukaryotic-like serine/threonine-protein kinase